MATGRNLIDVHKGQLIVKVNDQEITYNMNNALKTPDDPNECYFVRMIDEESYGYFHHSMSKDCLETSLTLGRRVKKKK